MKKVLVASAALLLAGGIVSEASAAAAVTPGVTITGNARARLYYRDSFDFGNTDASGPTNADSRVRIQFKGTAAGGAYVVGRIRLMDGFMSDNDNDSGATVADTNGNVWADMAYVGVPLGDNFTLEVGKYRTTYDATTFFYYDLGVSGLRGIAKFGATEVNPFVDWISEAALQGKGNDLLEDADEMRYGVHAKSKINDNWTVGGIVGYQDDQRAENITLQGIPVNVVDSATGLVYTTVAPGTFKSLDNTGFFAGVYATGKAGAFGFAGEFAYNEAELNGFNSKYEDMNYDAKDSVGTYGEDDGYGAFVQPSYTMGALTLAANLGFTADGFTPKNDFGFVMVGFDHPLTVAKVGAIGEWMWAGFVPTYQVNEALSFTGNLVYVSIDNPYTTTPLGPKGINSMSEAWEVSGNMKYTISKGADFYWYVGTLIADFDDGAYNDDSPWGTLAKFELSF